MIFFLLLLLCGNDAVFYAALHRQSTGKVTGGRGQRPWYCESVTLDVDAQAATLDWRLNSLSHACTAPKGDGASRKGRMPKRNQQPKTKMKMQNEKRKTKESEMRGVWQGLGGRG